MELWSIPRCWPGDTVAIIGSGPSLTVDQVEACCGRCRAIAVNRSYVLAPWADWLYGADAGRFWGWSSGPDRVNRDEPDALDFEGTKIVAWTPRVLPQYLDRLLAGDVHPIKHCAPEQRMGLSDDPGLVYGPNSVHHVLSVIHHTGAKRVILLGVDMRGSEHFHPSWPGSGDLASDFVTFRAAMATLVDPLRKAYVEVLNATPGSALECWPLVDLADVL